MKRTRFLLLIVALLLCAANLSSETLRTVDPLILPVWHQDSPWNARCPGQGPNRANAGSHALAVAKLMKYWAYPTYGTGSVSYVDDDFGPINQIFTNEIMWNNMSNTAVFQTTQRFIYMCGASIYTDYEYDFSTSSLVNVQSALINNFSYDEDMQYQHRSDYGNFLWKSMIREELDAARPVIYMVELANENEIAFLIDGYNDEGLFHINWSDFDYTDGWFDLNDLIVGSQVIPVQNQHMLSGIQPSNGPDNIDENFETDFSTWNWQFSGHQDWTISTEQAFFGSQSAKSGNIDDNQFSSLFIQINVSDADTISFYKKVSCEAEPDDLYDNLAFYIDNVEIERWSGDGSWEYHEYPVSPGVHEFRWTYSKDGASDYFSDCAWLDAIDLPEGSTPLNAPQFVEAEIVAGNDIQINWAAPPGTNPSLLGYKVYRNGLEIVQFSNPTITTYSDYNMPNGDYTYVVRGVYVEGISGPSNSSSVSVEVPYAPVNLTASLISMNSGHLVWDAPPLLRDRALMGFVLYRDNVPIAQLESPEILTYDDSGLVQGVYYYEVSAVYSVGESARSNMAQLAVGVPYPPGDLQAVVNGNTVNLSWSQVPNIDFLQGFKIFRNGELHVTLNDPLLLQYADQNLQNGSYAYFLRAIYSDGDSGNSATVTANIEVAYPPANLIATVNADDVQLTWLNPQASRALTHYLIYRNGQVIAATFGANSTSYLDQNLPNGDYIYQVTAFYSGVESAQTDPANALVEVLYPPRNLSASVLLADVTLSWSVPANQGGLRSLSGYNIYRDNVLIAFVSNPAAISYIDPNLSNGVYNYAVSAVYGSGESSSVTVQSVIVEVLHPVTELSYQITGNDVILNWPNPATNLRASRDNRMLLHYNIYRNGSYYDQTEASLYLDADLANGFYEYYVTVVYDSGESAPSPSVLLEIEELYPPSTLVATVAGDDVSLSWTAPVLSAAANRALIGYRIYRNNVQLAELSELSYQDTNLANGSYDYYVQALYSGGISDPTNTATAIVEVLYPPSGLMSSVQNRNDVQLVWQAPVVSGGLRSLLHYQITRNASTITETTALSYLDAGLADGSYTYQVLAVYSSGSSLPADVAIVDIEYPYPPANVTAMVTGADVSISWDMVPGNGVQYRLYRDGTFIIQTQLLSYDDSNLANGSYSYHITSINASDSGASDPSVSAGAEVFVPYPPQMLSGSVSGDNVSLSWTEPAVGPRNLQHYLVYRDGVSIGSTAELSYNDPVLANGNYSYYVTAVYDNAESIPSNIINLTVEILFPATDLAAVVYGDDVALSWTAASAGAGRALQGYKVFRNQDEIALVNVTTYTDQNLANGSYQYYVTAVYDSGVSAPSNGVTAIVEVWYSPSDLSYTISDDSVLLTWTAAPNSPARNLIGYNIYRDDVVIAQTLQSSYTDAGLSNGIYQYHVTALYSTGESMPTNGVTVYLEVLYPATGLSCLVSADDVSLTWMAPVTSGGLRNLLGYKVFRDGVQIAYTNVLAYEDSNLANGVYYYSVIANYSSGDALPTPLAEAVIEILYPPSSLAYTVDADAVILQWTSAASSSRGLLGYNVYREGSLLANTADNAYTDAGLANGTYTYYVTAMYSSGESVPTNSVQASVEVWYPPTELIYSVVDDEVTLQWTAAVTTGGLRSFTGYDLYRDGTLLIHTMDIDYTDSNLPNGNYSYYVTATYDSGTSLPSNTVFAMVEVYYPATALSASVSEDDVSLSWNAAVNSGGLRDIQGYRVYRNGTEIADVSATSFIDMNLINGSYQYYVVAHYSTGAALPSNTVTAIVEVLYPPTALTHTVDQNTVNLSWTAATNGSRNLLGYKVYRDGVYLVQTPATVYSDPGLANGSYQYYVSALYSSGESPLSNTITAFIEVSYPVTALTASVDSDNVTLNWTLPATNQQRAFLGYFIYRNGALNTVLSDHTQTTWTDSGLANGEYAYYLIAVYDSGLSIPSNIVTVNIMVMPDLPAPTGLAFTVSNDRDVSLLWQEPAVNILNYLVYRNGIEIGSTNQPVFSDPGLANGSYSYYVKAQYAEGLSSASEAVTVNIMIADPPSAFSVAVVNGNSAQLGWTSPGQNEIGYLVYRNGSELIYLAGAQTNTYLDHDLSNGTYSYQVAAVYPNLISNPSAAVPAFIEVIYLPANFTLQTIANSVHLSWSAPLDTGGLTHYNIYRNGSLIGPALLTQYIDQNLANGNYQYQISSVYSSGESALSGSLEAQIALTYPPSGLMAAVTDDDITLTWNSVSDPGGLVNYRIYRNGSFIANGIDTEYSDSGLANGDYSYYVTAIYQAGESSASNTAAVTVEVLYPATSLAFNVIDNDVHLNWTAPVTSGGLRSLSGYKIFRDNLQIGTTTQTSFTDLDLGNGAYQYYVVASYNSGDSAPTAPVNVLIEILYPAANLSYQLSGANVALAWDAVPPSGATLLGYNVYRNGSMLTQTTATNYTDAALANGTYSYYVSAQYASGESLPSNTVVANVEVAYAPSNLTAQVNIQDVVLGWTAAPIGSRSFLNYAIYRNGNWLADVPYTAYTDHHPGNGSYSYYVIAVYSTGASEPSNTANATILIAYSPSTVAIQQNPYTDNIFIQWTAPSDQNGLTAYRIYRNSALLHTSPAGELQYLDQGMPNGQYSYYVTCMYGTLESNPSTTLSATVIVPHAPTNLTGTLTGNNVSLSWTPPADPWGLTNYRVWMNSELLMEVTNPAASILDLDNGTYEFQITAIYPSGQSGLSNIYSANVIAAYPPQNASCTVTGNDVVVQWNQPQYISGLTNYRVFRDDVQIGQTTALNYIDNDLANANYHYTVVAVFGTHLSNPADAGTAHVEVIYPPTSPQVQVDANSVTFSWAAVADAGFLMNYRVFRNGSQVSQQTTLTYTDNNMGNGTYAYTVQAVYQAGASSLTTPAQAELMVAYPPRSLAYAASGQSVWFEWDAPIDMGGFTAYRITRNGTVIATISQANYTDAPISNGHYAYKIDAVYANGESAGVEVVFNLIEAYPVQNLSHSVEGNSISLDWDAPMDAYGLVEYQVVNGSGTVLATLDISQTSCTLDYMANGLWRIWIRTIYAGGVMLPQQEITSIAIMIPYAANNLNAEVVTETNQIHLTWDSPVDIAGFTSYIIRRNGILLAQQTARNYIDTSVANGDYVYEVVAVYNEELLSEALSIGCTMHHALPARNVAATIVDGTYQITWDPPSAISLPDYYDVHFLIDGQQEAPMAWTFVAYVDSLHQAIDAVHGNLATGDFLWVVTAMWLSGEGIPAFSNVLHIETPVTPIPEITKLKGNYPNPFNPNTTIKFDLHQDSPVKLKIYNARGQLVRKLYSGNLIAGEHQFPFDGKDDSGRQLGSGLYIYRVEAHGYSKTKKMMLMK